MNEKIIIQNTIDLKKMTSNVIRFLFTFIKNNVIFIWDETFAYWFCVVYFHHLEIMQQCSFAQMGIQSGLMSRSNRYWSMDKCIQSTSLPSWSDVNRSEWTGISVSLYAKYLFKRDCGILWQECSHCSRWFLHLLQLVY